MAHLNNTTSLPSPLNTDSLYMDSASEIEDSDTRPWQDNRRRRTSKRKQLCGCTENPSVQYQVKLSNRFIHLTANDSENVDNNTYIKTPKPTPIYVDIVTDYKKIVDSTASVIFTQMNSIIPKH